MCRYAKTAGKSARASWLDFTKEYFAKREALVCVLLLVDGSIPPQQIDLDCANWLAEAQVGGKTGPGFVFGRGGSGV
jgi:GTP-binding protein EngB required for normal cell division